MRAPRLNWTWIALWALLAATGCKEPSKNIAQVHLDIESDIAAKPPAAFALESAPSSSATFVVNGGNAQLGPQIPPEIALGNPADLEKRRKHLYELALDSARKRYQLELDAYEQQEMDRIARLMPAERERVLELIRPIFEEYAAKIGPARQEFYSIGGIPPRVPRLRRSLRLGDWSNEQKINRYGVLLTYLGKMDAVERFHLQNLLDRSSEAFDSEFLKLKVALFDKEQQAEKDAIDKAKAIASQVTAQAPIVPRWIGIGSAPFAWTPVRSSVQIPGISAPTWEAPTAGSKSSKERTLTQARIWAKMQGVQIGSGGKNATQEFEKWVRKITGER